MTKKLLVIAPLLATSSLALTACHSTAKNTAPTKSSEKTSHTIQSSKSADTTTTKVIEKDYQTLYADTLSKVLSDADRKATHYAFYDIDNNGTKELFTASKTEQGVQVLAAYYLKNNVSTYLADNETAPVGGRRAKFQVNKDKTISQSEISSYNGEGSIKLYQLRHDNSGLDLIKEVTVEKGEPSEAIPSNNSPLDLTKLEWQAFDSTTSQTETTSNTETSTQATSQSATASKGLDLQAIAQGDLSSIAGTYQGVNSSNSFTFNADGTGSTSNGDHSWNQKYTNFKLENGMATFSAEGEPTRYYIIPAGISTPSRLVEDRDDINRNRVYVAGEGFNIFFLD